MMASSALLCLLSVLALVGQVSPQHHQQHEGAGTSASSAVTKPPASPLNFASVSVRNDLVGKSVRVRYRTQPCVDYNCLPLDLTHAPVQPDATTSWFRITTETAVFLTVLDEGSGEVLVAQQRFFFGDRGGYVLAVSKRQQDHAAVVPAPSNDTAVVTAEVVRKPDVTHGFDTLPMLWLTLSIVVVCGVCDLFKRLYIFERIPCLQLRAMPTWAQHLLGIDDTNDEGRAEGGGDGATAFPLGSASASRRGSGDAAASRHHRSQHDSSDDELDMALGIQRYEFKDPERQPLLLGQQRNATASTAATSTTTTAPVTPTFSTANQHSPPKSTAQQRQGRSRRPVQQTLLYPEAPLGRVQSLDTMRGLAFCALIFVQAGGGDYYFMRPSAWNGLTVADLLEPGLLWVMGFSMALSLNQRLAERPRNAVMRHVAGRTIWLFFVGLVLENPTVQTPLNHWRISGPLQRFAFVYFVIALVVLYVPLASEFVLESNPPALLLKGRHRLSEFKVKKSFLAGHGRLAFLLRDVGPYTYEWLVVALLMVVHAAIMYYLPVPGCGKGYLGPGGISEMGAFVNCTGGAQGYIDGKILGHQHQYLSPSTVQWYHIQSFDAEGIVGHLSAVGTAYFGVHAAHSVLHFRRHKHHMSRVTRWMFWCVVFGLIGLALCGAQQNTGAVPVNKNLWSLSFTAVCTCISFFLMTVVYVIVDWKQWWSGTPVRQLGLSPILIYVASNVLIGYFPFDPFHIDGENHMQRSTRVAHDAVSVFVWVVIGVWLERRGVQYSL
eukprot:m.9814 g.9814  ORF g.9814 m.9814 type:complete len:776 (-) comp3609_c0_seq1:233-2560(-)